MKIKAIALALSLVFVATALGFQNTDLHLGTWKLNEAKSKFAGTLRNHTVVYEKVGDKIKITVDGVDNGTAVHNEWTGKFDGKDYPVTGDLNSDARSYRVFDHKTLRMVQKKDGKITLSGRITLSADNKTRTVTTTATNSEGKPVMNVAVYDRQ